MTSSYPNRRTSALLWFGVLGAPLAWAGMHVAGVGAGTAGCGAFGSDHNVDPNTWGFALTIGAGAVALGALTASVVMWRATRTDDSAPPLARMHFLATLGLVLAPLFLCIILMAGLGASVLSQCVQS